MTGWNNYLRLLRKQMWIYGDTDSDKENDSDSSYSLSDFGRKRDKSDSAIQ